MFCDPLEVMQPTIDICMAKLGWFGGFFVRPLLYEWDISRKLSKVPSMNKYNRYNMLYVLQRDASLKGQINYE